MPQVVIPSSLWAYLLVSTVAFSSAVVYSLLSPGEFITNLYSGKWRALVSVY